MKPVIIGDATLYHGDCLEILPTLDKVDAVVTDPPYGTGCAPRGGKQAGTIDPSTSQHPEWDVFCTEWIALVVTPAIAVFCPTKRVRDVLEAIDGNDQYIYVKTNPNPLGTSIEVCVVRGFGWNPPQHITAYNAFNGQVHPTQKPVEVMEFVCSRAPGDSVLDPYMGSGTTGVACANLGRKFIGIELERKYFDIACERIDAAYAQGRLFA